MRIAVFLPSSSAAYLRSLLPNERISEANSWIDLDHHLSDPEVELALIDPSADGILKIGAATRLLRSHRDVPFIGYMPLTNERMKAVATLAREGLAHALLHPVGNSSEILRRANELLARRLGQDFLRFFETRLMNLDSELFSAIQDLLDEPRRYYTAGDLAQGASCSRRRLYRVFERATLGSPRKFVIGARTLRAYSHLRRGVPIGSTAKLVGCTSRTLCEHTLEILGCAPARLRHEPNANEVLLQVIEWIYKPSRQYQRRAKPAKAVQSNSRNGPSEAEDMSYR